MDTIVICDLEVNYRVGVPEEERAQPQRLLLTIELALDFTAAAASDDLAKTINYFEIAKRLLTFGNDRAWKLIEKLAVDIADFLLAEFQPEKVCVEVKKFILPETRHVAVRVTRPMAASTTALSPSPLSPTT